VGGHVSKNNEIDINHQNVLLMFTLYCELLVYFAGNKILVHCLCSREIDFLIIIIFIFVGLLNDTVIMYVKKTSVCSTIFWKVRGYKRCWLYVRLYFDISLLIQNITMKNS
jgi:hypothetical protein